MSALPSLFILALLIIAMLGTKLYNNKQLTKSLQRSLDYYGETYRSISGWDCVSGNFMFVSIDGGKNWFNAEHTEGGGINITGPADMDRLKEAISLRALMDHVSEHGPIDPSSPTGLSMLTNAGFTVEYKQ